MDDASPTLDVLLPAGSDAVLPDPAEVTLDVLYREPRLPWVRANMIASIDGAMTGADGRSGSINGPADGRVFRTLRAWADVVLVGAGTVRAEGYRAPRLPEPVRARRRAAGRPADPSLAVVTRSGDLPPALLADAPWVFTTPSAPHLDRLRGALPADRLQVGTTDYVDVAHAVAVLHEAGHPRVLTEGGPHLLGTLLAAEVVDELCLTWSPAVVGGPAGRIVDGAPWLGQGARLTLLLHADGVLLGRWALGGRD